MYNIIYIILYTYILRVYIYFIEYICIESIGYYNANPYRYIDNIDVS